MATKPKENNSVKSEKKATYTVPRQNAADTEIYVSVNGENAVIQKGKPVKMPAKLAWALINSQEGDYAAEENRNKMKAD